jgi:hypothetical protein
LPGQLHVEHGLFRAHAQAADFDNVGGELLLGEVGFRGFHRLGRAGAEAAGPGPDEDGRFGHFLAAEQRNALLDVATDFRRKRAGGKLRK